MRRLVIPLLAAAALVTFAIVAGCSGKSSSPTNPGGGGGGTSATIHSGIIAPNGGSFSFTFPDSGTTNYHCAIHPAMVGAVTVTSTSANDSLVVQIVNQTSSGFSPGAANVKPGGTVRWVNAHSTNHTVDTN